MKEGRCTERRESLQERQDDELGQQGDRQGQDEEWPALERRKDQEKKGKVMPTASGGKYRVRPPVKSEGRRFFARREAGSRQVWVGAAEGGLGQVSVTAITGALEHRQRTF